MPTVLLVRHGQASFGAADYEVLSDLGGPGLKSGGDSETMTNRGFQAALEPAPAEWVAHAERSPTAQTWPRFAGAGSGALAELAASLGRGETAVVVTSGGTIAGVVGTLLGAPSEAFASLNRTLVNASVTKLANGSTGINVVSFNDHSHLETLDRALVTYR